MSQGGAVSNPVISRTDPMPDFDAMPEVLRRLLANAPLDFNPTQFKQAWERSGLSAEQYAEMVVRPRFAVLLGQR